MEIDIKFGRRFDYVSCLDCGAKWEVDWKGEDFQIEYVKLLEAGSNTEGRGYLKKELAPDHWRKMALRKQGRGKPSREAIREKEIIKEVVVKVRCPYCGGLYEELKDRCPHCGGKR